ncbi:MAG TPA: NAD(P)/FAD-dependent oxidoreductase [Chthoniobacteraceae bacterium]
MISQTHYDVIVIGGGPAGSTAAALLAEKGRRVLLLEKERFPRYHVGESMMPFCWFTLERLGLVHRMDEVGYTKKYSVQFVRPDGQQSHPFYFFQHYEHPSSTTWQIERSDFDLMLLDRARELGAEVHEETAVRRILKNDSGAVIGVEAAGNDGVSFTTYAPVTIDATGREGFAQIREGWRVRDQKLNKVSIWTYFRGAKRDPGLDEGTTTVAYIPERGWFWYIPLRDDIVSVGVVAEKDYLFRDTREPGEIMKREIEKNTWLCEHLAPGEQFGQYWVTSDFSYRAKYCAADGLVLVGDAFAFLDPVFSSGVFLALKSGEMAADAVDAALTANDVSGARFSEYGEHLCRGIENIRKLVYSFYDPEFSFGRVVKAYPHLRGRLTDCLIGDLFDKDFDELFAAVGEFAELPEPLDHGRAPATAAA